ncbi:MAG: THUMP domain-containing protein [Bacteroidia bacterium]
MDDKKTFTMIAKTFSGMEDILMNELEAIGATNTKKLTRAVEFEGDNAVMYKANLYCRTALRILKNYTTFEAANEQQLYDEIKKINWSEHFSLYQTFAIDATLSHSNLNHSQYAAQKAKDAIADQFREAMDKRPSVDTENPDLRIHLHVYDNKCTLSFDSSGESLHKRGYRDLTNQAPINEALAAGLVLWSGWDKQSTFVDFMCGSGTILIEAAMIARNIAPNKLKKKFGFQSWKDYDEPLWAEIYDDALMEEKPSLDFKIIGADKSGIVLDKARQNIFNAGLENDIELQKGLFENFIPPTNSGVLITNPPYGVRIEDDDLLNTYKKIGDTLKKNFAGWKAWIFTGNLELAKFIGLRPTRKLHLFNGPIECRFLKFEIYSGTKRIHKFRKENVDAADQESNKQLE